MAQSRGLSARSLPTCCGFNKASILGYWDLDIDAISFFAFYSIEQDTGGSAIDRF